MYLCSVTLIFCKGHNDSAHLKIIREITRITSWNESELTTLMFGQNILSNEGSLTLFDMGGGGGVFLVP